MTLPDEEWLVRPMPPVDEAAVTALLAERFGVQGDLRDLGSQQDRNYRVGAYVLKIANPATAVGALRAQCAVIERLAEQLPDVRLPRARAGADGDVVQWLPAGEERLACRLLAYVPGEPVMDSRYFAPPVVARLGELAGRVVAALATAGPVEPESGRLWDLRYAAEVIEALAPRMADQERAARVLAAARAAWAAVEPYAGSLPVQVIHGDLTDNNVVCDTGADGRPMPVGVIDFGDLGPGWAVSELAVTCTSVLHHHGAGPASVLPAVDAFRAQRPLSEAELAVLWPLVVLRAGVLVVSGQYDASLDPGNAYASAALEREWAMFEAAVSVPVEVMTALLAGGTAAGAVCGHRLLPGLPDDARTLDLSVHSDDLHSGRWREPGIEAGLAEGYAAAVTRHGEFRLTRAGGDTCALGVEVYVEGELEVRAPWPGTVTRTADGVRLTGDGPALFLDGVDRVPGQVEAGDLLGTASRHLHVQLCTLPEDALPEGAHPEDALPEGTHPDSPRPPRFAPAELASAWLTLCPDPTPLLLTTTPHPGPPETPLLARRTRAFAPVQEHYYAAPPRIERGWRHHLFDTEARPYLDMLNNVTILGHGHPALGDAVHKQWRKLNTNSRFHYASVVELSERLTELLPEGLDTVFLVNSGSEAVDLALRLAWAATGRQDTVAVEEAYHGWTFASDAVSTSVADNPNALASRPDWVHTVAAPNSYRGLHRGEDAHRYAPQAAARIAAVRPGAFICEPFYGNAGGMPLPDGYLKQVYEAVRKAGGLCIADEVQVGYGRLGTHFWGFEQQGVVPDIVTVAKAMGNGHPLGAVVTRREIADAYRTQGYFFSSAGGSPVSSVVGLAVLDALRDEGLQANALDVGGHLKERLRQLAGRHELIGAVHGSGLYLGVEFVRDRTTLEPATEETAAICERLRELGVIMQPTSDRQCVLKIKPPLCLTRDDADVFVEALDDVLTHGW
ncbi:aminotransferase [Streptomyces niveiscabiei]|uniref:aminotransferase n=1 Tax=Streptomyces niveiscabiei TaxID=164115 RepID=UPI0029BA8420|nr:aminotransferase [Streptomyces niveiscabiei]MDX3385271.1 aminotransferase [Streptomyces niveiscabiei]